MKDSLISKNRVKLIMKIVVRMLRHPRGSVGGAERQMELIGSELVKKNVDFHYISDKIYDYQKKLEDINGIKVHFIGLNRNRSIGGFKEHIRSIVYAYDFFLFLKYIYIFNFDIYHLRGATEKVGAWAFFAKIIKRNKFVFTAAHINNCIPKSYPWGRFSSKIYEYGLKRADVVVVLANYMKNALYHNYGINSVVIKSGHPVPIGPFKKDDPPSILWIARPTDVKRPKLFLQIAQEISDLNIHFILIGPVGPGDPMKKVFETFDKRHKNFIYIHRVNPGEDNKYYEKASLFVNTSSTEGYPNSFIQAWLRETPVITLDVDPDCDICKNSLGYHAKGDLKKLINEIKKLIENPSELKEMGRRCRQYAIKNHNIEKTAEQHFKLYNWILKKR